jgi:ABC-type transport system involved in cytochrome c biogenesis permease component
VLAVELVVFPVYGLFFQLRYGARWPGWRWWWCWRRRVHGAGDAVRAIAAHTRLGETLLPILLLPLLIPVVIFAAGPRSGC